MRLLHRKTTFKEYFEYREHKLDQTLEEDTEKKSTIFHGCAVYFAGYTESISALRLKTIVVENGGSVRYTVVYLNSLCKSFLFLENNTYYLQKSFWVAYRTNTSKLSKTCSWQNSKTHVCCETRLVIRFCKVWKKIS